MDKLARQLRDDAGNIEVRISDELDARILASLNAVTPEGTIKAQPERRPVTFWWWSSVTGVAAALALIAVINLRAPEPQPVASERAVQPLQLPGIDWKAREAVLTSPLEEEIDNLQDDLKKAEEAVRQDIDRLF